jgi:LacI family transcriptional regulator
MTPHTKPGKRKSVALFMGLADTYEHGIARGVVRYAKERHTWDLYGYGWMFRPFDALEYWRGDGVIARVESTRDADRLGRMRVPVVDVAGAYAVRSFYRVTNDDTATGRKAGAYLASCGFRRFAYCGVADTGWSAMRKAGFQGSVADAREGDVAVFEEDLPWWESLAESGPLRRWLAALEKPAGIFACNDTAGLKLAEMCRAMGIAVPETVAILGVDDEDILCEMASPSLSSIRLDCESIGYRAAALLDAVMTGAPGAETAARIRVVPPRDVVERDSTRVFTCDDPLVAQAVRVIRARATGRVTVGSLLGSLPASRRSLETRFKRATGRTLREEIIRVRLAHARALLRGSRLTVAAVAAECGFGSVQRFHSVFRKAEGMSPGGYREAAG